MNLYPLKPTEGEREQLIANINGVFWSASMSQYHRGITWYQTANAIARIMGADARMGAGLLAVLSAQRQWLETVKLSLDAADGRTVRTLREQQRKIERILSGEDPANVLPMERKTGQFYQCILDPFHPDAVVIDRHAHDIARGGRFGDFNRGLTYAPRYKIFAEAYREAARRLRLTPCQLQSVTWVVWTDGTDHKGFSPEGN